MKAIVRLRKEGTLDISVNTALENCGFEVVEMVHPKDFTFAEFNNHIFRTLSDEYYLICDNDTIVTRGVYDFIRYIQSHKDCVMVCGCAYPNNKKIRKILKTAFTQGFNFSCTVVRSSFLKDLTIPSFMECSEDSFVYGEALLHGKEVKQFRDIEFLHVSDNWEVKLLESLKWTFANGRLYWEKTRQTNGVISFAYNYRNVKNYADLIYMKVRKLDENYAKRMRSAIMEGFMKYKEFLHKYNEVVSWQG